MTRTSITIDIDLDDQADTPAGSASLPNGTSRAFHGWLGLVEAVDALVVISARGVRRSTGDGPGAEPSIEAGREGRTKEQGAQS
jgi:hypothetical protein